MIKVPADPVSGESSFPDVQMAVFLLHPHMAETRERRSKLSGVSSYQGTNAIHEGSTLMA